MTKTQCLNAMVEMVCAKEKGKKQLNAGQAREIIKVFSNLFHNNVDFGDLFYVYNNCFLEKKAKKKK